MFLIPHRLSKRGRRVYIRYYLGLGLLLFFFHVQGQPRLSGRVEETSGKGLPFANVLLLNARDSSLVKGMVTDQEGSYRLENPKKGQYRLMASMVGYSQVYSPLFSIPEQQEHIVIPPLVLRAVARELSEVTVVAQKPLYEQHLDRLVVNVQSSIASAGATALDVIERSPGITVNRQIGSLAMNGKEGVMVMVNGKLSRLPMTALMQMLSGMNAGNIEKIELLSTPPARFDAEGNAGLINIVLKTNTEYGTHGSYSLTAGYNWHEKAATSFSLNHRTEKLNLYGEYSLMYNHTGMIGYDDRKFIYPTLSLEANTENSRDIHLLNHNARVGVEYLLSPKTTLGGGGAAFSNRFGVTSWNVSRYSHLASLDTLIHIEEEGFNRWHHLMGNVNLRHSLSTNEQVSLDVDYLYYYNINPRLYSNSYQYQKAEDNFEDQFKLNKYTPIRIWVGKCDYIKNLTAGMKLEAGVKGTLSRVQNEMVLENFRQEQWQRDNEFTQNVWMKENIGASYLSFHHQMNTKTKLQVGLRYEYSQTELEDQEGRKLLERRNGYFFPSLSFSRDFSKEHSLQLSYNRRILRPTYNDLAPYVVFADRYSFYLGNIRLKPTLSHILRIGYRFKENYLLSLQYSHDQNAIAVWQVKVDPQTRRQYTYPENIDQVNTLSFSLSFPLQVGSFWQMQHTFTGNWQDLSTGFEGSRFGSSRINGQINWMHSFKLPHAFSFELSGFYQTASLLGLAVRKGYGSFNMGLQKKLSQEKGTFRLSVEDLFWTLPLLELAYNQPTKGFSRHLHLRNEPRVLRLTYSANFGNKHLKGVKRNTASEEERKRVSN